MFKKLLASTIAFVLFLSGPISAIAYSVEIDLNPQSSTTYLNLVNSYLEDLDEIDPIFGDSEDLEIFAQILENLFVNPDSIQVQIRENNGAETLAIKVMLEAEVLKELDVLAKSLEHESGTYEDYEYVLLNNLDLAYLIYDETTLYLADSYLISDAFWAETLTTDFAKPSTNFADININDITDPEILNYIGTNNIEIEITEEPTNTFNIESTGTLTSDKAAVYSEIAHKPALAQKFSKTNTLLFAESYNLAAQSELQTEILDELIRYTSDDEKATVQAAYTLLENEFAFALEVPKNDYGLLPYITIIGQTNTENSNILNAYLEGLLTELISALPATDSETLTTTETGGVLELTVNNLDPEYSEKAALASDEANALISDNTNFTFTYGTVADYYVLSTNPEIETQLNSTAPNSVLELFPDQVTNGKNVSLAYADFETYLKRFGEIITSETTTAVDKTYDLGITSELGETLELISTFSEIEMLNYSQINGNTLTETGYLKIDLPELIAHFQVYENSNTSKKGVERWEPDYTQLNYTNYFEDVPANSWYGNHITNLVGHGIILGETIIDDTLRFYPERESTRAEFVAMVVRLKNLEYQTPNQSGEFIFSDVDADQWYPEIIGIAYENGIITGDDGTNTFRPNDTLSRAEAVEILKNAYPEIFEFTAGTGEKFNDVNQNNWYYDAVEMLSYIQVVEGTSPGIFNPDQTLNRAQAATIINRFRLYLKARRRANPLVSY